MPTTVLDTAYRLARPLLFQLDAERMHRLGMGVLGAAGRRPFRRVLQAGDYDRTARLAQSVLGHTFPNPVGLAAGFDKNAERLDGWGALGFGFVEVGTVTPKPQPGNRKPRLFRMKQSCSIQNAMGFNNFGAEAMLERLKHSYPLDFPVGVNLGKNRDTPLEQAMNDYLSLVKLIEGQCDYFVVNLSSPNTPGLRELENPVTVHELLQHASRSTLRPILLKVSPDRTPQETVEIAQAAVEGGAAGIIATNTTVDYALSPEARDFGGISGGLLRDKSFSMLEALAEAFKGTTVLISVGGIDSAEEAYRRIRAGASLVQVYTGLIYEGPGLVRRINEGIQRCLDADGFSSLGEAIGVDTTP